MMRRLLNLLPSETLHGYENLELVETIFRKTMAYEPTEPWVEMEGVTSVLDFGGACGRHYKEARRHTSDVRWAVVDTPTMVSRAKELETHQLKFFSSIELAADWLGSIEVVHSNGSLQYASAPLQIAQELCSLNASKMLWRRLLIGDGKRTKQLSLLSDNGPGRLSTARKKVSYDRTAIDEAHFLELHQNYRLLERGSDWFNFVR